MQGFVKGCVKGCAPDGVHENIEFNEYKDPAYWLKRRARRALLENVGPFLIVLATLAAFVAIGIIEVCL